MATCSFLPRSSDLHQLDHALESNLSDCDPIAGRSAFSKLSYFGNSLPTSGIVSEIDSEETLEAGLMRDSHHNVLEFSSDRMSHKKEATTLSGEAGLVSSGSIRSAKEEDCDLSSSSDNRDAGQHPHPITGKGDIHEVRFSGISKKRTRMGDVDFSLVDGEKDHIREQNTIRHPTVMADDRSGGTLLGPTLPLISLGNQNNELLYSRADPPWLNSNFPFLTPVPPWDLTRKNLVHEEREREQKRCRGRDFPFQQPANYSYLDNSESRQVSNSSTARAHTSNEFQSRGTLSPMQEKSKRLMLQSQELGTSGLGSVSFSSQEGDSDLVATSSKGSKDTILETLGREQKGSTDWKILYQGQPNAPGRHIGVQPSIYQQGCFLGSQENLNYAGMAGVLPFTAGQVQLSNPFIREDSYLLKSNLEPSNVHPNSSIQVKATDPALLQKNSPESSVVRMLTSTSQLPASPPPSSSAEWCSSGLQFIRSQEYQQSSQKPMGQSNNLLATCSSVPWVPSHAVGHGLQSSDATMPSFPSHFNKPLPTNCHMSLQYPSLGHQDPSPLPRTLCQDVRGRHQAFSEGFESMGLLLQKPFDLEASPSVTVVMEGRSIGRSLCLQNYDGYNSFAKALRDMFESDISSNDLAGCGGTCNLENAIPGHIIAYEDSENDLLLAGDLSWKDFIRATKRIRILPSRICRGKGEA